MTFLGVDSAIYSKVLKPKILQHCYLISLLNHMTYR